VPSDGSGESLSVRIQVSWGDCDPAGIVFYPRFYAWMDSISHVLAREMGISRDAMLPPRADLVGFPIVAASATFRAPARLDDLLEVRTQVCRIGRSSFSLSHRITRLEADGGCTLVATGREDRVFIAHGPEGMRSRELTPHMRKVLTRFYDGVFGAVYDEGADGLQRS
jgi:4-hydroxybenzoyl-CoA thioesterase